MSARESYLATITGATARADQLVAALRAQTGPIDLRRLAIAAQSAAFIVSQLEAAPRRAPCQCTPGNYADNCPEHGSGMPPARRLRAGEIMAAGDVRRSKSDRTHSEAIPESYYGRPVAPDDATDFVYFRPVGPLSHRDYNDAGGRD